MFYTLWLAFPNQMTVIDIHAADDLSSKNDLFSQETKEEKHNRSILLYNKHNHFLSQSYWIKIHEFLECSRQNFINGVSRKRNTFNILVASEKLDLYVHTILECIIGVKLTASAKRIFLNSVLNHDFDLKLAAVLKKRDERQRCLDILMDVAIACYIAALTNNLPNIDIKDGLKNTATSITETAATNTATLGIESAAQVIGNAMAGAAISAIVDVAVSSATIYVAKRQKDEGRMTEEEFNVKIKKTVCESSLKFVGGTTGSILGQALIPVPVVGAFVGGFCGSLIGAGIGKGINYGMFDRKNKKAQNEKKLNDDKENAQIQKRYGRKIRGYVPKIIIYNESKKVFEEKHFQKTIKNYFKPAEILNETQATMSEASVTVKPYLNKWRNKTLKNEDETKTATVEKQLFVLSKWKKSAIVNTSDEKINSPDKEHSSDKELSVLSLWKKSAVKTTNEKSSQEQQQQQQQTTDKQLSVLSKWRRKSSTITTVEVDKTFETTDSYANQEEKSADLIQDSSTEKPVLLKSSRRDSYIDRLSPNLLITQVKSSIIKSSSKEEVPQASAAETSLVTSPISTAGASSPRSNTPNDVPIFQRLSIKSLKESFRNISNSSSRDEIEFENDLFSENDEFQQTEAGIEEEIEEESKFSRFKSFHSSIRLKNRERMKFRSLQKESLFSSSIDAEGNVYDRKSSDTEEIPDGQMSPRDNNNSSSSQAEKFDASEFKDIGQNNVQSNKADSTLNGLTNRLLSLTGARLKSTFKSPSKVNAKRAKSPTQNKKLNESINNNSTDESFEEHSADKRTSFYASLSSSLSDNSSKSESPELQFSEREYGWWNRKLRHRFENETKADKSDLTERKATENPVSEQKENETKKKTSSKNNSEEITDNEDIKKEKKLFSTLKSFTKKFK